MKATVSIFAISSLLLATFAASGETNDLVRVKASSSDPSLSRSSSQVLQLAQAGMDESVITSFISNSVIFQLSADQIVYLNDLGVPSRVIQAMLAHDCEKLAATSQDTNTANRSVVVQQDAAPAISVEQSTSQDRALANVQTEAQSQMVAVVPVSSSRTEKLAREDLALGQRSISPQSVPPKKKVFYPVRAPYPVELTAPIVFLDAPTF